MARGWESKSVEDQMAAAEAAKGRPSQAPVDELTSAREARRAELRLSRARVLQDLQVACDKNYRAMLQRTLEHIDRELASLPA